MGFPRFVMTVAVVGWLVVPHGALAAKLLVGTASTEITPPKPVAVCGQFNLRIARDIETPLTANVIAVEAQDDGAPADSAIMVSCDVVSIPVDLLQLVREKVHGQWPDLDTTKIFLSGTHTHTAPVLAFDEYKIPTEGVMQVAEYRDLLSDRVAAAIVSAWKGREPGCVTWGSGQAVVGHNRRAAYADGSAQMYGATNRPEFQNLEGYEDHDVNSLFFFNQAGALVGVAVNVACPAQEVEGRSTVNADFWHPVRVRLRERFGNDLCVLGWIGAAGDQSPHLMYGQAAEERMRVLRGLERTDEIARRIVNAVEDTYEVVQKDRHADVPLIHNVETLQLPMRLVNEAEYTEAKTVCDELKAEMAQDPTAADRVCRRQQWYQVTVDRFEKQKTDPHPLYGTELHAIRIGDAAICTNSFELFTDYGIRMKARSPAVQTFVIQLTGPGSYLPTEKAVRGGHYSAVVHSSLVGPAGGQLLVDRTVELLNALWKE